MDIFARPGTKVSFRRECVSVENIRWGSHVEPLPLLNDGQIYTVQYTDVHSMHTKVFLDGFPEKPFNSIWFEDADMSTETQRIKASENL